VEHAHHRARQRNLQLIRRKGEHFGLSPGRREFGEICRQAFPTETGPRVLEKETVSVDPSALHFGGRLRGEVAERLNAAVC
jgi:hypothetical protein